MRLIGGVQMWSCEKAGTRAGAGLAAREAGVGGRAAGLVLI